MNPRPTLAPKGPHVAGPRRWRLLQVAALLSLAACGADADLESTAQQADLSVRDGGSPALGSSARRAATAKGSNSSGPMVQIPTGKTTVDGESVSVPAFSMDAHEVTNNEFAAFIQATGFQTEAERIGNSVMFFHDRGANGQQPFDVVSRATWDHPKGPESDLSGIGDHPVVHVSWNDASHYAEWAEKRLPTRAEWIRAASGGLEDPVYPWGDEIRPNSEHMMNSWQGVFPEEDRALDGYRGTSPVGSFPPNAFGVFDMAGNVWEWTAERMRTGDGPEDELAEKRGGSFLCREEASSGFHACRGYEVSSLEWSPVINGNDNVGFRCAR